MKVFISWSRAVGQHVAQALRDWIPDVVQAAEPWFSHDDIEAGTRWSSAIMTQLQESGFGVIVLTPDSLERPWIHFEAGACAMGVEGSIEERVVPFLVDTEEGDVPGALQLFHAVRASKSGAWKLIQSINSALGEAALTEARLKRGFERTWPELEERLAARPPQTNPADAPEPEGGDSELMATLREIKAQQAKDAYELRELRSQLRRESPWPAPPPGGLISTGPGFRLRTMGDHASPASGWARYVYDDDGAVIGRIPAAPDAPPEPKSGGEDVGPAPSSDDSGGDDS